MSVFFNAVTSGVVVELSVIIVLAVSLVSFAALVACRWLKLNPSLRHCVSLSALICVLLSPLLAFVFAWSDTAMISISLPAKATAASSPQADISPSHDVNREAVYSPSDLPEDTPVGTSELKLRSDDTVAKTEVATETEAAPNTGGATGTPPDSLHVAALVVFGIWGIGTMILLVGMVRSLRRWRGVRRSSRPVDDARVVDLFDDVRRILEMAKLPEIHSSSQIDAPVVVGLWRPLVVLPTRSLQSVSVAQMRDALVHEIAHVLRRDHLVVVLQAIARAIFWPIPLISLLNRQLDRAREEVCDNYVLADRDAIDYGETLLRFAELATNGGPLPGSIGMLQWRGKLEDRISTILNDRRNTTVRANRFAAIAIAGILSVMCAMVCGSRFVMAQADQPRATNDRTAPKDDAVNPDITSLEDVKTTSVAHVFDIADLVQDEPKVATLIKEVEMMVERPAADKKGSLQPAYIRYFHGRIVLRASQPEHDKVADLLQRRRNSGKLSIAKKRESSAKNSSSKYGKRGAK